MSKLMSSSENVASEARTQLELEVRPGDRAARCSHPPRAIHILNMLIQILKLNLGAGHVF